MAVPHLEAVVSGLPLAGGPTPTLILGSALGSTMGIWDAALPDLERDFHVIRFDLPGHGITPTAESGFTMDELADAVADLATRHGVERFAFAGVSIGGAIALVLARRHPHRLTGIGVVCSAATFGGVNSGFLERAASVRAEGMGFVTPAIPGRWFAPSFIDAHPGEVERIVAMVASADPHGYAQCCEALATYDESANMSSVAVPTIVISGELDPGCPPEVGEIVANGVPAGSLVVVPDTSHLAVAESPAAVAAALREAFH